MQTNEPASRSDFGVSDRRCPKGKRILACLGEINLEESIPDLETVYRGSEMKLRISDPIVEFGETTDWFEGETVDLQHYTTIDRSHWRGRRRFLHIATKRASGMPIVRGRGQSCLDKCSG
jgi:hypothetical protein